MKKPRKVCYILMVISTVFSAFGLIPMLWMISMTLLYKGNINDDEPHTALGICLILFAGQLGIIAEIIMIASYKREDKIDKIENYFIYN